MLAYESLRRLAQPVPQGRALAVVVDAATWERIVAEVDTPTEPSPALLQLMRRDAD